MERALWQWDAAELATAIRTRKISSREAVQAVLHRLDAVNPALNAVTVLLADQALAAADRADAAVKRTRPPPTGWWRSRTSSPRSTARPSPTGSARAR
jgi:Asp-tRNA(Asn)/Glu-tRNA(Gln) amidotransferase A subunit family amidase